MKRLLQFFLIGYLLCVSTIAFSQSEPSNHVTGLDISTVSDTELSLSWNDAAGPTDPEFYLIVGRKVIGGTFATVADGTEVPADADWSDGNFAAIVTVGTETLSVPGLTPGTEYSFRVYSYQRNGGSGGNSNYKTGGSVPVQAGFTFSLPPSGHSTTFTATLNGDVDIDLTFDPANTLTNADGYVIYRRAGSAASLSGLNNGAVAPSTLGGTTILVTTSDDDDFTFTDAGLSGGVTYHYVLVPYNYNGTDNETYSFLTDGSEPRTSATTNLIISMAPIAGVGTNIATDPLGSGANDQAILGFSITTNGPTTFNGLNVGVTTTAVGKFTSPRIFKSSNAVYGSDLSINAGTPTATQLQFSGVGDVLTAGTTNYFIVVNVSGSVNDLTPAIEPSFSETNVSFTSPAGVAQPVTITGINYSFIDASPPTITSLTPADGATGVSVLLTTFSITFNEDVNYVGDNSDDANRIRIWDDDGNSFVETINVSDVNVTGNVVTFTTDFTFDPDTDYDVVIGNSVFEDLTANPFPGTAVNDWEFETELGPDITSLSTTTRCVADQLIVNGTGFTGTGGTGNTKPFVFINGVQVTAANITIFSSTSITITVPSGATTGNVTVQNRDNLLTSNGISLTVLPQINTGISVLPDTGNPSQGTNVDIDLSTTQTNYSYHLILVDFVGVDPYVLADGTELDIKAGNDGLITMNTAGSETNEDLDEVGDYSYRIDVTRTGCTTRTLSTTFTLTVAQLDVNVSATDVTVCNGAQTTLIGSASGGTGFYQFRWTSTPVGYSSNSSSPTVTVTGNTRYHLELEDNAGNITNDFIDVTVLTLPVVTIDPVPGQTIVQTSYTIENNNYRLYGSPAGGVFSGPGVFLNTDGFYYFNPQNAGVGPGKIIVYTYTDGNGCSGQDTENFTVLNTTVNGLNQTYCENQTIDTGLAPAIAIPGGYQFTRLIFYSNGCTADANSTFTPCGLGPAANPLTVTSTALVPDIQAGVTLPPGTMFLQPTSYSLNLSTIRTYYPSSANIHILIFIKNSSGSELFYTNQNFRLLQNDAPPNIVGINENENVCEYSPVITLTSSVGSYNINNFSITSGYSGALSGTNNRDFNPDYSGLDGIGIYERSLFIQMAYTDNNNCPNTVTRNFTWVKKPDHVVVADTAFCQFADPETIRMEAFANGSADRAIWYDLLPSNPLAQIIPSSGFILEPGINGTNAVTEIFFVGQVYKGCEGDAIQTSLTINLAPDATITAGTICENRNFLVSGPEETPGNPYSKYQWSFQIGLSSTVVEVDDNNIYTHNYGPGSALAPYTIGLTVTTTEGCTNFDSQSGNIGQNPLPDFSYNLVCDNDKTEFNGTTDIPVPGTQFQWDFGDLATVPLGLSTDPAPEGGTVEDPIHEFLSGPGDYTVTISTTAPSGCFNSKTKTVSILEYLTHTSSSPYDMGLVDGGRGFWKLEDIAGNSTWEFAIPTTKVKNEFTLPAWVTNADGLYSPGEYSFLNSPCLDISGIERPVLSLDYVLNTQQNLDGFVMEYSKDGGLTWSSLGGVNSGFNWINTTGFFSGTIGSSTIGWSGNSWELGDNVQADTLVQARRALDNIDNLSLAERAQVRFRIAFKTDSNLELDGIAFNNLTIASRNRVLLVENFTNESDAGYSNNNTAFKNISISEAVKIQYHVAAPGDDANYLINTADPSARAAFYGIPLTDQSIPRGYIDGFSNGNFTGTAWVQTMFSQRALKVAPYSLVVETAPSADPTYIQVTAKVTALEGIPDSRNPILHLALVEKTEGNNEYVLRKLIPTAVGKKLPVPMLQSTSVDFVESVRIENPDINISQLAVVGFIQDEVTREIYQADIDMNPANLPTGTITGTEDPAYAEKINLFPNPANNEINIQLPVAVTKNTPMRMIDTYGRTVVEDNFALGDRNKTINTSELTEGVYIMQINTTEGKNARRKIMVIHR